MTTENKVKLRFGVLLGIVSAAIVARIAMPQLLGRPFNVSPIDAIALFSGCYFSRKWAAFIVPLLAVWVSDIFTTRLLVGHWELFYQGFYWQYACYPIIVMIGSLLSGKIKVLNLTLASLGSSVLFFIISNFGTWASFTIYPKTIAGLVTCYAAGVPFFSGTLISDLIYTAVLFGSFELAKRRFPVLALK
jgi:hypothetical protein